MDKFVLNMSDNTEISSILEIIFKLTKNYSKPEFIYVFGEYLKYENKLSNLVKEGDYIVEYRNNIEILIVTRKTSHEKNTNIARNIVSNIKNDKRIDSSVNIIIDDIYSFKQGLKQKRYFYLDIVNEGILLYDSKKYNIKFESDISANDMLVLKKGDFNHFFTLSNEFLKDYKNAFIRKTYRLAIFYLHQSLEMLITCYLIVKTGYKPKTHDIEILYSKLKSLSGNFNKFFDLEKEAYYFDLLRKSYVNSRYKKDYIINKDDLIYLESKLKSISKVVKKICLEELKL